MTHGTPLAIRLHVPPRPAKGSIVIEDDRSEDIRALFDWRAAHDGADVNGTPVANDDLALALSLLSCNSRDREQFSGGRAAGTTH